ncbi:MAG: hypothetical protein ACOC44_20005 [Promethearchaeia archaeon]
MARRYPYGSAKLKILEEFIEEPRLERLIEKSKKHNLLLDDVFPNQDKYTRELRSALKKDPKLGAGKGSFEKSNFDRHLADLEEWGLIEVKDTKDKIKYNKGKLCRIKENRNKYYGVKKLYDKFEGDSIDFLSNDFVQFNIDDSFLIEMLENEKAILYILIQYFSREKYKDQDFLEEIYEELDLESFRPALALIVFPPHEIRKIIDIIRCSPSAFNMIMNPNDEKIKKLIWANLNFFVKNDIIKFSSSPLISTDGKKIVKEMIFDLLEGLIDIFEEKDGEEKKIISKLPSILGKEKEIGPSPMFKVLESKFDNDLIEENYYRDVVTTSNFLFKKEMNIQYMDEIRGPPIYREENLKEDCN